MIPASQREHQTMLRNRVEYLFVYHKKAGSPEIPIVSLCKENLKNLKEHGYDTEEM
jgi:hypothetical protein